MCRSVAAAFVHRAVWHRKVAGLAGFHPPLDQVAYGAFIVGHRGSPLSGLLRQPGFSGRCAKRCNAGGASEACERRVHHTGAAHSVGQQLQFDPGHQQVRGAAAIGCIITGGALTGPMNTIQAPAGETLFHNEAAAAGRHDVGLELAAYRDLARNQ